MFVIRGFKGEERRMRWDKLLFVIVVIGKRGEICVNTGKEGEEVGILGL